MNCYMGNHQFHPSAKTAHSGKSFRNKIQTVFAVFPERISVYFLNAVLLISFSTLPFFLHAQAALEVSVSENSYCAGDAMAPVFSNCPRPASGATAFVRLAPVGQSYVVTQNDNDLFAYASDNCPDTLLYTYTLSGATTGSRSGDYARILEGAALNKGITTVTWYARDNAGNLSAPCVYNISVQD